MKYFQDILEAKGLYNPGRLCTFFLLLGERLIEWGAYSSEGAY